MPIFSLLYWPHPGLNKYLPELSGIFKFPRYVSLVTNDTASIGTCR